MSTGGGDPAVEGTRPPFSCWGTRLTAQKLRRNATLCRCWPPLSVLWKNQVKENKGTNTVCLLQSSIPWGVFQIRNELRVDLRQTIQHPDTMLSKNNSQVAHHSALSPKAHLAFNITLKSQCSFDFLLFKFLKSWWSFHQISLSSNDWVHFNLYCILLVRAVF